MNTKKESKFILIIAVAAVEIVSIALIGANPFFPYGLAFGTVVSIICVNLIGAFINRAIATRKKNAVYAGFALRVVLYAGVLVMTANTDIKAFAGCAIGLLLPFLTVFLSEQIIPAILRALGKAPAETHIYIVDNRQMVFEKAPSAMMSLNDRTYFTHRHFRRYRRVPIDGSAEGNKWN